MELFIIEATEVQFRFFNKSVLVLLFYTLLCVTVPVHFIVFISFSSAFSLEVFMGPGTQVGSGPNYILSKQVGLGPWVCVSMCIIAKWT